MTNFPSQRGSKSTPPDGTERFPDAVDFRYPKLSRVVIRAGSAVQEPPSSLRNWDSPSVVVVVNRSLADSETVSALLTALKQAGIETHIFVGAMQHCPLSCAVELATLLCESSSGSMISVGGSSVSDTAKAALLIAGFAARSAADDGSIALRPDLSALRARLEAGESPHRDFRLIAIPSTLSGGEFTPVVGISDPERGHKAVLRHPSLHADLVILDPLLQRTTPDALWASTGFKLLDHAVERLLARNHQPLIDAQCCYGIRSMLPRLALSLGSGSVSERARSELAHVLWVIQSSHGNVGTGLSHALSHQLGSLYGLNHGEGSAICLPATLRLLGRSGRIDAGSMQLLANAFAVEDVLADGEIEYIALEPVISALVALRERLNLPGTLSDAGIQSVDAERVARAVLEDPTSRATPGAPLTAKELIELVEGL